MNWLGLEPNFTDMILIMKESELQSMGPSNQVWREITLKQVLNDFDNAIQNLAMESLPYLEEC
jgi:hypothetical protein